MSRGEEAVRVVIDEMKCVGIGYCVKAEPGAVEMLDEGYSRALPGRRLSREAAERLVERCPSKAIRIEAE